MEGGGCCTTSFNNNTESNITLDIGLEIGDSDKHGYCAQADSFLCPTVRFFPLRENQDIFLP